MRILKEPKVYLVSRPAIVQSGWDAFLSDQRLKWPTPSTHKIKCHNPFRHGNVRDNNEEESDSCAICHNSGMVDSPISDAERLIELFGRNCYMSYGEKSGSKTNTAYLYNLIGFNREGPAHGSVTEHCNFGFVVVGAGRGFSHEQVRHRAGWAYSQLSTRYCDFEREEMEGTWDPGFVIPPLAQLSDTTQAMFEEFLYESQSSYHAILNDIMHDLEKDEEFQKNLETYPKAERSRMLRKAARGAARDILPIATEAIMGMTGNVRAIWNTIVLRANAQAEAPIRSVYIQIARIMEKEMPAIFSGLEFYNAWDGSECVQMPREKL